MKLDFLAIGAHPDDVELGCSGTLLQQISLGHRTGIVDLTQGELGTRGTAELRKLEAEKAGHILGVNARENLGLPDGFFRADKDALLTLIRAVRKYQPDVVLAPAEYDRHVDHGRAASLVEEACFLSGLIKIETPDGNKKQEAWRPRAVYHYFQDRMFRSPDLIIDITPHFEKKMESIRAYSSQFYQPGSSEPDTYISSKDFMENISSRAREFGRLIGVTYGEGYTVKRSIGSRNLADLF